MRSLGAKLGRHKLDIWVAENQRERRRGMRYFPEVKPLLLSAAPLIHTWGCTDLDLVWIRSGRVLQVTEARSGRLYFCPAWHCLELPSGMARALQIRKKDTFCVLGES